MKVIALDIDGVLNSERWTQERKARGIRTPFMEALVRPTVVNSLESLDQVAVLRLGRILEATGAQILLSSTWRMRGNDPRKMCNILRMAFSRLGVDDVKFIGHTPVSDELGLVRGLPRGEEIHTWLTEHPVDHLVILDDDTDMDPLREYWIQTHHEDGLQDCHVEQAIAMLEKPFLLPR